MTTFNGINSYMNHLKSNFRDVMKNELSENNNKLMEVAKKRMVYDSYNPTEYQRTYEFLYANKSVVLKKGGKSQIYMQTYTPTTYEYMPSGHRSWIDNSNQNSNMPFFIQYGNNSSLYSYIGRNYYDFAYTLIKSQLKSVIRKAMKKRGIDIR